MVADKSKVKKAKAATGPASTSKYAVKRRFTKAEKALHKMLDEAVPGTTMTDEQAEQIREQLNRGDFSWFLEETD